MIDTKGFIVNVMANTLSIIIVTKELEKSTLKECALSLPAVFRLMARTNILGNEILSGTADLHIISGPYLYLNFTSRQPWIPVSIILCFYQFCNDL
jgi:hypothetical protein